MTREEFNRLTPAEKTARIHEMGRIIRLLETMKNPKLSMRTRNRAMAELNCETNAPTIIAEILNEREKSR
jgi:hypothetical protein